MNEYLILAPIAVLVVLAVLGFKGKLGSSVQTWLGVESTALKADIPLLEAAAKADLVKLEAEFALLKATITKAVTPVVAAPVAAPVPSIKDWVLGTSYSNLGAMALDLKGSGFTREIDIDGVPIFNIGGGTPVLFYTVGVALTQTKPA